MNRLEWILGILLVVLLVIVAALSLVFWFRPDAPTTASPNIAAEVAAYANQVEPTPVHAGHTAQIAYTAARETAVSWQNDAILLSARATWPQGMTEKELRQGETTWTFTFYSAAADKTALISVIDNKANIITQGTLKQPANAITPAGWHLDSSDAIDQLLEQGGTDFINREGITSLTMTLTTDPENGRIQWLIQLAATQSLRLLTMNIDATSGEILSVDQTT